MEYRWGKSGLLIVILALLALLLASCAGQTAPEPPATQPPTNTLPPTSTPSPSQTPTPTYTVQPTPTPAPEETPTPSLAPTLALPVGLRTPYPAAGEALSIANLPYIEPLARYGGAQVRSIRLSVDGRTLVIGTALGVEVYDAAERTLILQFEVSPMLATVDNLWLSDDAGRILIVTRDGIQIFNRQGEIIQSLPVPPVHTVAGVDYPARASISPDGSQAMVQTCGESEEDCVFHVFRVEDNQLLFTGPASLRGDTPRFTPDGAYVAADQRGTLRLWNATDWSAGSQIFLGAGTRWTFSPDARFVAIQRLRNVEIRNLADRRLVRLITDIDRGYEKSPNAFFSPHGNAIAILTESGQLTVWDVGRGNLVSVQNANFGELALFGLTDNAHLTRRAAPTRPTSVVAPEVVLFEFGEDNRSLRLVMEATLDAPAQSCSIGYGGSMDCAAYAHPPVVDMNGDIFLARSEPSGNLTLLNTAYEELASLPVLGWATQTCWLSGPQGFIAITRSNPAYAGLERVELRHLGERRLVKNWIGQAGICVRSADQRYGLIQINLSTPTRTARVHHLVMDLETGAIIYDLPAFPRADKMALSANGQWVARAIYDPEQGSTSLAVFALHLLAETATEGSSLSLPAPNAGQRITAMRFSPDSSLLAVGFADGALAIYPIREGQLLNMPEAAWKFHSDSISELAFSADGALLATYSQDGFIQVFGVRVENP